MIFIISTIILSCIIGYQLYKNHNLKITISQVQRSKQSSDIIRGQISEQLVPLIPDFKNKYDMKYLKFLGQPLDYIYFGDDKIVFIEVKTGNARMSKRQQKLKALINNKQVFIEEYRVTYDN
jgi:predicted Holliday junction resolvase-like endonuclease